MLPFKSVAASKRLPEVLERSSERQPTTASTHCRQLSRGEGRAEQFGGGGSFAENSFSPFLKRPASQFDFFWVEGGGHPSESAGRAAGEGASACRRSGGSLWSRERRSIVQRSQAIFFVQNRRLEEFGVKGARVSGSLLCSAGLTASAWGSLT